MARFSQIGCFSREANISVCNQNLRKLGGHDMMFGFECVQICLLCFGYKLLVIFCINADTHIDKLQAHIAEKALLDGLFYRMVSVFTWHPAVTI